MITFDSREKRICSLTKKDREILKKYEKMDELPETTWEQYEYSVDGCPTCKIPIKNNWVFCPECGNDLPVTEFNKDGCKDD